MNSIGRREPLLSLCLQFILAIRGPVVHSSSLWVFSVEGPTFYPSRWIIFSENLTASLLSLVPHCGSCRWFLPPWAQNSAFYDNLVMQQILRLGFVWQIRIFIRILPLPSPFHPRWGGRRQNYTSDVHILGWSALDKCCLYRFLLFVEINFIICQLKFCSVDQTSVTLTSCFFVRSLALWKKDS